MKIKIIICSLLLIAMVFLSIPSTTMAAWWNPFSWSWNPFAWFNKTSIVQPSKPVEIQTQTNNIISHPPEKSLKNKDPQQLNSLINQNKSQLLEASKILSNKNIIAKVKPAVVYIETSSGLSGSGMIIESNGYVLTNAHVVTGFNFATIKLTDGRSFNGRVIGRDEGVDLVLLKINTDQLFTVTLGDSDSVEQGDPVFTFGYPLGIEGDVSFKDGTISRRLNLDGTVYFEMSAQILPGNSGGPLVNQAGDVIGINTQTIGASEINGNLVGETLKFALPINLAKTLIPDLKSGRNIVLPKTISPTPPVSPPPTPNPTPTPSPLSGLQKMNYCMKLATQQYQQAEILAEAEKKKCEEENQSSPGSLGSMICFIRGSTPSISSYYSACLGTSSSSGNGSTYSPPPSLFPPPSLSEKELQKMCDLVNGIYRGGNCY